jgi:hypothetical protein
MEQFNYHKLVNLRKRFNNYDCEISKKILYVINECIDIEKENSKLKDKERRDKYQIEKVKCDICNKEIMRTNIYKHKKNIHPL